MTDQDMIDLCAEAMGIDQNEWCWYDQDHRYNHGQYNPLINDALALDLLRRMELNVGWESASIVHVQPSQDEYDPEVYTVSDDRANVNRAIVKCVAGMQKGKKECQTLPKPI